MNSRILRIVKSLEKLYPNPKPSLFFKTPFESLVATILSAQCTDKRVNIVTKNLFKTANTAGKILKLGQTKLEKYVKPTGFYRAKAKNIINASKMITEKFSGEVPKTLEQLTSLPGVGRKTANVLLAQAYKIPAFPVDRHIFRVSNRLGLANAKTPEKTEEDLMKNIDKKYWISFHLQLMFLGRKICRPKPKCDLCPILPYCLFGKNQQRQKAS